MIGIVIASHGPMADAILETSKLFFSDQEQFTSIGLQPGQDLEEFDSLLQEKIAEVDSGDGVLVFVDLLFGTPCNRTALMLNDNVEVIAGVNLGVILEVLGGRQYYEGSLKEYTNELIEICKGSVGDLKEILNAVE